MQGDRSKSGGTMTSLDGTRTITVEEFDWLFDDASDEIDQFIDWSKARMVGDRLDVSVGRADSADKVDQHAPRDAAE